MTIKMRVIVTFCLLAVAYSSAMPSNELQQIIDTVNSAGAKWKAGSYDHKFRSLADVRHLLGTVLTSHKLPTRERHLSVPDSSVPEEFDARKHWPYCPNIGHIRDQGNCGSCWAVAAAGTLSDRFCIASNGTFTDPLSQEELLSCCGFFCGKGCQGGDPASAWEYFTSHGLVTGGDYNSSKGCQPYEIQSCDHHTTGKLVPCTSLPDAKTPQCIKKCTNAHYEGNYKDDHHKTQNSYTLEQNENEIKKEILLHGPVEAAFLVYADFPTYKSGVYHHVTGGLLAGHAVRVIGWGVENGTPYWLVANSWNEDWGEEGLFKILRGSNECWFEQEMVAGIPSLEF